MTSDYVTLGTRITACFLQSKPSLFSASDNLHLDVLLALDSLYRPLSFRLCGSAVNCSGSSWASRHYTFQGRGYHLVTDSLRPCGRNLAAVVSEIGDSTAVKDAPMRIAAVVHKFTKLGASHTSGYMGGKINYYNNILLFPTSYERRV